MALLTKEEREQRLDQILASYLEAVKQGSAPSRQELLKGHPELAEDLAAFFENQDRFNNLAQPLRLVLAPVPTASPLRDFGDYEILSEIARGGMGVVYQARQKSLGRLVALKMLLAGPWASSDDLQRFRAEAEAVAQLDHPNIVPIYEVGTHEGRPYLSMKFIEGGSLAKAINDQPLAFRQQEAARLVATLARAVHHAHQHGILHRDLKPANILLSLPKSEGESASGSDGCIPMITDFGLAKRAAQSDWIEPDMSHKGLSTASTMPMPPPLTNPGAIVGTPSYMAPEQASGKPGDVTTAVDVYGLGAILYELLTGRPPFRGKSPLDTVRQVLEHEPTRPSLIKPAVDRDLETICLKCLSKEPQKRYASADELAADLGRYLRREPILARPVSPLERLWRLVRRQPVITALIAALILVLVGGIASTTTLWLIAVQHGREAETQRDDAKKQRQQADEQRQLVEIQKEKIEKALQEAEKLRLEAQRNFEEAEDNFRMAHRAVQEYCRRVSDELRGAPSLQPLRKSLLQDALTYYENFLKRRGNNPALRRELAEAYQNKAFVTRSMGNGVEARGDFQKAHDLFAALLRDAPSDVELQRKVASTLNSLASMAGSSENSLVRFTEVHNTYTRFLDQHPTDLVLLSGLGLTLNNLGAVCARTGRPEARDWLQKAIKLQERLREENPRNLTFKADLANTLSNYAILLGNEADGKEESLKVFERARDLRQELSRARPRDAKAQSDLQNSNFALGSALRDAGRLDEAMKTLQQAQAVRLRLARENPFVTQYQMDLAASYIALGVVYNRKQDRTRALDYYGKARDIQERIVRLDPDNQAYRRELGMCYYNLGTLQGTMGRRLDEYQALQKARELQEGCVKADPDNLDFRTNLGRTLNNLGWNRMAMGHTEETPALIRASIEHVRLALARAPRVAKTRQLLNSNYGTLAEAQTRLGHFRAAAAALRQRQELWPDNPEELYRVGSELAKVADRVGHGKPELSPSEKEERKALFDQSLEVLRQAINAGFRDVTRLQQDKAFKPLQSEDSFLHLLEELKKKASAANN